MLNDWTIKRYDRECYCANVWTPKIRSERYCAKFNQFCTNSVQWIFEFNDFFSPNFHITQTSSKHLEISWEKTCILNTLKNPLIERNVIGKNNKRYWLKIKFCASSVSNMCIELYFDERSRNWVRIFIIANHFASNTFKTASNNIKWTKSNKSSLSHVMSSGCTWIA